MVIICRRELSVLTEPSLLKDQKAIHVVLLSDASSALATPSSRWSRRLGSTSGITLFCTALLPPYSWWSSLQWPPGAIVILDLLLAHDSPATSSCQFLFHPFVLLPETRFTVSADLLFWLVGLEFISSALDAGVVCAWG